MRVFRACGRLSMMPVYGPLTHVRGTVRLPPSHEVVLRRTVYYSFSFFLKILYADADIGLFKKLHAIFSPARFVATLRSSKYPRRSYTGLNALSSGSQVVIHDFPWARLQNAACIRSSVPRPSPRLPGRIEAIA